MSIQTFLSARISSFVLDPERQRRRRSAAERRRRRRGLPHEVHFFHQVDDPYSHLLAQALVVLHERYDVVLRIRLVPPPADWAVPERDRLRAYAVDDARALAKRSGFSFTGLEAPPRSHVDRATRQAAALFERPDEPLGAGALTSLIAIGDELWASRPTTVVERTEPADAAHADAALVAGAGRRDELGHYLGATCWYAGEWTWGIDRLADLEDRLDALGARREVAPGSEGSGPSRGTRIYAQPRLFEEPAAPHPRDDAPPELHFFLSFRSPYTYIATAQVIELARATGADLRLRFVLPMVMRGLPIRRAKRFYILRDAAREARRHRVPFAPIADPVGRAVERGYSLLPWAISQGRGPEYCLSFMAHVWSCALDAARDRGLQRIVEDAGLDWSEAERHVDDPSWKATAEENRQELLDLGLWGVPSFRVGELAVWGQDRLWRVEDALRTATPND